MLPKFLCLSLNFTLCSLFAANIGPPPGFISPFHEAPIDADVAPSARQQPGGADVAAPSWHLGEPVAHLAMEGMSDACSRDQWRKATWSLEPSLRALFWNPVLCSRELRLIRDTPPELSPAAADAPAAPTCALPFVRRGNQFFPLEKIPKTVSHSWALEVAGKLPCTMRAGGAGIEVCVLWRRGSMVSSHTRQNVELAVHASRLIAAGRRGGERGGGAGGGGRGGAGGPQITLRKGGQAYGSEEMGRGMGEGGRRRGDFGNEGDHGKGKSKGKSISEAVLGISIPSERISADLVEFQQMLTKISDGVPVELDPRLLISAAIAQINEGQSEKAISLFDIALRDEDEGVRAQCFVGRGTANTILNRFKEAIHDFSQAIELRPNYLEPWKKRSVARAGDNDMDGAILDMTRALELDPSCIECYEQRGRLAFNRHDYWTALSDFNELLRSQPSNWMVLNAVGLALMGSGRYEEAANIYRQAVAIDPRQPQLWYEKGRAEKEVDVDAAEESLKRAIALEGKKKSLMGYQRLTALLYSKGDHRGAVQVAEEGLQAYPEDIDLLYHLGGGYHARGYYLKAIMAYEKIVSQSQSSTHNSIGHAFYMREVAAYTLPLLKEPLDKLNIDDEMDATFREAWCRRMSPLTLFPGYQIQPVHDMNFLLHHRPPQLSPNAFKIIREADRIGPLTFYSAPGFSKNRRHFRMAGLAAIDTMQLARDSWYKMLQRAEELDVVIDGMNNDKGTRFLGGKNLEAIDELEASIPDLPIRNWRDVFENLVKWRQLAEPMDTVLWVDHLTNEFEKGFGSVTAMTVGQMRNWKYYPLYDRGFEFMKESMLFWEEVMNGTGSPMPLPKPLYGETIDKAQNLSQLWDMIGENFYVVTPCYSEAFPDKVMNGTQLYIVKSEQSVVQQTKSFDFAIRTPVTPSRVVDFDLEMSIAWKELCAAVLDTRAERLTPEARARRIQDVILRIGYYWYQLMPLTRGSAMVGYVSIIGLFLAADMEITATAPPNLQVDWEAILGARFQNFHDSVAPWLYPSVVHSPPIRDVPNLRVELPTIDAIIAALSYQE